MNDLSDRLAELGKELMDLSQEYDSIVSFLHTKEQRLAFFRHCWREYEKELEYAKLSEAEQRIWTRGCHPDAGGDSCPVPPKRS